MLGEICLLLYAMAKGSFRMMGRLFGIDPAHLYRMIRRFGESLPEPEAPSGIQEMEFGHDYGGV
jgi:transposase-like protein